MSDRFSITRRSSEYTIISDQYYSADIYSIPYLNKYLITVFSLKTSRNPLLEFTLDPKLLISGQEQGVEKWTIKLLEEIEKLGTRDDEYCFNYSRIFGVDLKEINADQRFFAKYYLPQLLDSVDSQA